MVREKLLGSALAGSMVVAAMGACGNAESGAFDVDDWKTTLPDIESIAEQAIEIDTFSVGEHNFKLGSLDSSESPLESDILTKVGAVILESVDEDGLGYTAYAVDEGVKRLEGSETGGLAQESTSTEHFVFLSENPEPFADVIEEDVANIANTFTIRPVDKNDLPTLTFISEARFEQPGFKTYHDSSVSALEGAQITELCQALVEATVALPADTPPQTQLILGNELFCNSVSRAVAFALDGESYENYQADIRISPLEVGQNALGLNIPYLRVTSESYAAIARGEVVALDFVPTLEN